MSLQIRPRQATGLILLLLSLLAGCGPEPPTEQNARAWHTADEALLSNLAERIDAALTESRALEPTRQGEVGDLDREVARNRRLARLREQTLPNLVEEPRIIGLELRLVPGEQPADDPLEEVIGRVGQAPPTRHRASVRAADGVELGGNRLGWGLYNVETDGGSTERQGYEVSWQRDGDRPVRVTVFVEKPAS